jgi:peptide chain release factor 3
VYHRPRNEVHLFKRDASHGSREISSTVLAGDDPILKEIISEDLYAQLQEELEMLEELTPPMDMDRVRSGDLSPVFFGSAMNNFGVSPGCLLDHIFYKFLLFGRGEILLLMCTMAL